MSDGGGADNTRQRYVIIMPARDESAFLPATLDALARQTVLPLRCIIVDDGSSDTTGAIAARAAGTHPWIQVVTRADRGRRLVGPGVVDAFYAGMAAVKDLDYDYICKFDADILIGTRYFETLLGLFQRQPRLGSASGKVYMQRGDKLVPERMSDEQVAGQAKFYRRPCFEEIGGFIREVMWDVIDGHLARMKGWDATSLDLPELRIVHQRLMGSSQGSVFQGRFRWGGGNYFIHAHPLYVFASSLYRMVERPRVAGGLCILAGYLWAAISRRPRYGNCQFRRHLRAYQLKRLREFCSRSAGADRPLK